MITLRRWMRAFWHHRPPDPPMLPHFGCTQREMTEHFDRMAEKGRILERSTVVWQPMSNTTVRLLAEHIRRATP